MLEIELPYGVAISLLSIYPKEMKPVHWKDTCTLALRAAGATGVMRTVIYLPLKG